MKLSLHFADSAFLVSDDVNVSPQRVSLELRLCDCFLLSIEISFLGQKKIESPPFSSSWASKATVDLHLYSYRFIVSRISDTGARFTRDSFFPRKIKSHRFLDGIVYYHQCPISEDLKN
jgi:hypothetical protein